MIDLLFFIIIIIAIVKGYQKGLIIALFSIIAFIVGIAAAIKLSAAVAVRLQQNITVASKWLPVLSFVLVFFIVVLLIHLGAKLIQKTFELALLGWANRLGGILLYIILYTIIFSVFLFYADKLSIFDPTAIAASKTYPLVAPFGPKIIDSIGHLIPLFKDSFAQLQLFFEGLAHKIER